MSDLERASRGAAGRARRRWPKIAARASVLAVLLFAVGVALGLALDDRPVPGRHPDLRPDARAAAAAGALEAQTLVPYSSSDAWSSPATITAIAAARLIQSPTPRFAKKKSSGTEITRTSTKIVAERAERDGEEALRDRGRRLDPDLAEHEDEHDREPDEQDELAEHARVPSEHGDRHALALRPCTSR